MIFIDKPSGISSFDVIRKLRKILGVRKMGHAGTLDPLATGLLIVGVGEETKMLSQYIGLPKVYEVVILMGERYDTGDITGRLMERKQVSDITKEDIQKVARELEGDLFLPVPIYSAIKRRGEALYKKARRGETFSPPKKKMTVSQVQIKGIRFQNMRAVVEAKIYVNSGVYIRSVAEKFGELLAYPATVARLRRVSVGDFCVKDACSLDDEECIKAMANTKQI